MVCVSTGDKHTIMKTLIAGRHARGRLVEQDHLRLQGKGGGDVEQLLLALRQQARQRCEPLLEAEDAWGNTMTYSSDGRTYSIVSSGPDGVSGTADDLTLRDGNISGGS